MSDFNDGIDIIINSISTTKLMAYFKKYSNATDINEELKKMVQEVYTENFENADIADVMHSIKHFKFKRNKKRWVAKAIRDYEEKKKTKKPKELLGQYLNLKEYQMGIDEDIEDIIKKSIKKLETWESDDEALMMEYIYLNHKTPRQIESAMKVDIAMFLGNYLLNAPDKEISGKNDKVDFPFVPSPFFGTSRSRGGIELNDSAPLANHYQYVFNNLDGLEQTFLIDKKYADNSETSINDLDSTDFFIYSDMVSKNMKDLIYNNGYFVTKLEDIVESVYSSHGIKNYETVKNRLIKMANFRMRYSKDGVQRYFSLFDVSFVKSGDSDMEDDKVSKTDTVRIGISDTMYEMLLYDQTSFLYRDEVDTIGKINSLAYQIIMILQRDRIGLKTNHDENAHVTTKNFTWFCGFLRFKKKKSAVLKDIDNALRVIIEQKIVLKSFIRRGDVYDFVYFPVEKDELDKLTVNTKEVPHALLS